MLNLNNEITYNKGKDFLYYLLGLKRYKNDFTGLSDLNLQIVNENGETESILKNNDENSRLSMVNTIRETIKAIDSAFSLVRIDYDFNNILSTYTYEEDYHTILSSLQAFCKKHKTIAFIGNHNNQLFENTDYYLCRHSHIIYAEPIDETFTEYLLKEIV